MTLAELCVKRGVFAVMLIAFLVVLGVFSFRELGVDLFPRADPATVNINVRLPGATAGGGHDPGRAAARGGALAPSAASTS